MKHKHNYIIWLRDTSNLPPRLKRYVFKKEASSKGSSLYINSFVKGNKYISITIWNRTENNQDIYEEYSFPADDVISIEEISYKTTTYTPKGKFTTEE